MGGSCPRPPAPAAAALALAGPRARHRASRPADAASPAIRGVAPALTVDLSHDLPTDPTGSLSGPDSSDAAPGAGLARSV